MSRSDWMHKLILAAHAALFCGLLLWTGLSTLGIAAALLLLLPAPGLWRGNTYVCGWASMLLTFYCAFLLADLYAHPQAKAVTLALASLAGLEFLGLLLFVRLRAQERRAQTA